MPARRFRWQEVRVLARGGQAEIVLFRDLNDSVGRLYVGKRALSPDYADLIRREHRILSKIVKSGFQHAVYEDDSGPGGYTSYRRYYEGQPLSVILKDRGNGENPFLDREDSEERFLNFAQRLIGLVYHLHVDLGLVHRDINPRNVLYAEDGTVALIDLGIALRIGELGHGEGSRDWADHDQLVPGTPAQPWHDMFSLGLLFYWVLEGDIRGDANAGPERGWPQWVLTNHALKEFISLCRDCWEQPPQKRPTIRDFARLIRRATVAGLRRKKVHELCPNPECGAPTAPGWALCYHCLTPLVYESPTAVCPVCSKEVPLSSLNAHYAEAHPNVQTDGGGGSRSTSDIMLYTCPNCYWSTTNYELWKIHKSICKSSDPLLAPKTPRVVRGGRLRLINTPTPTPKSMLAFARSGIRFETLEVYYSLDIKPFEHQEDTVLRALRDLDGRCIIADSVGLGKTIECGIILRELIYRDLIDSILILVPSSELQYQWLSELDEKFHLGPDDPGGFRIWEPGEPRPVEGERIIATFWHALEDRPIPEAYADIYPKDVDSTWELFEPSRIKWDAVVVDEAHELGASPEGRRWQRLYRLDPRYLLLVTATPMKRSPSEIYPMIRAIDPILAGDYREFAKRYGSTASLQDLRQLRGLLSQVMIRHTRADVPSIIFPKREAKNIIVQLGKSEKRIERAIRQLLAEGDDVQRIGRVLFRWFTQSVNELALAIHQRTKTGKESRTATQLRLLLRRRGFSKDVKSAIRIILQETEEIFSDPGRMMSDPKLRALIDVLKRHQTTRQKVKMGEWEVDSAGLGVSPVIVFAGTNLGRDAILKTLKRAMPSVAIDGFTTGMSIMDRQNLLRRFNRGEIEVLVCGRAQSRGLNLQYGNFLINMDLPRSPVELEQRIGRVQRLRQRNPMVFVATIMYDLKEEKALWEAYKDYLLLFQETVGELDLVSLYSSIDITKQVDELYNAYLEGRIKRQQMRTQFKRLMEAARKLEARRQIVLPTEADEERQKDAQREGAEGVAIG